MKEHIKIDEKYYLISQKINSENVVVPIPQNINHIIVIDVSGSMYNDLPEIRRNLKK